METDLRQIIKTQGKKKKKNKFKKKSILKKKKQIKLNLKRNK
jgi:hypothetical protein